MSLSIQPSFYQPYTEPAKPQQPGRESGASAETPQTKGKSSVQAQAQSEQDQKIIEELKSRDREVRAHEQAHVAAAGGLAQGGPSYTYQYGPDGQAYAVGGEVNIDTSPGRTPQESINKAKQIRAAALAPADPSGQDRAVAAAAAQLEAQAQQELAQKNAEEGVQKAAPTQAGTTQDAEAETTDSSQETQAQQTDRARQAAALYKVLATATPRGSLINVAA